MSTKVQATIAKTDVEQRLVFGWGNVAIVDGATVVDKQDDWWKDISELEDTAYDYVLHSRDGGDTHLRKGVATMVESFVATPEKLQAIGLAPDALPQGWWVGFKVHDDVVWNGVKKGDYTGFSIGGSGKREPGHEPVGKVTKQAIAKSERTDPLLAALHAVAAVNKHMPGLHNQKSHGGDLNPLGSAFDKAFASALQDGHGLSFAFIGAAGSGDAEVKTFPPKRGAFKQTPAGPQYTLDSDKGQVVVEFDNAGRFRSGKVGKWTYSANKGADLSPPAGGGGKAAKPRTGSVPSQDELATMSGKTPKPKSKTKAKPKTAKNPIAPIPSGADKMNQAAKDQQTKTYQTMLDVAEKNGNRERADGIRERMAEWKAATAGGSTDKPSKNPPGFNPMLTEEMQDVLSSDKTVGRSVTVTPLGGKPITGTVTGVGDSWVNVDGKHYTLDSLDSVKVNAKPTRGDTDRATKLKAGIKRSEKAPLTGKEQTLIDGLKAGEKKPRTFLDVQAEQGKLADQIRAQRSTEASKKFDAMQENDNWQGYGYLGERINALDGSDPEAPSNPTRVAEVDAAVVRYAQANGVSDEQLFEWANSKSGRLFADSAFGSSDPIDDVMSKAQKWGGLPKGSVTRAGEAAARGDEKGMKAAAPAIKAKGKPDGAGTAEDPVAVGSDLDKAVRLLSEGKHVRLDQNDEVATLLDKLATLANEAKAKGESAPDIDLCKISVPGTNLFCHDSKGIPRAKMPQFKGKAAAGSRAGSKVNDDPNAEADIEEEFTAALKVMGIKVEPKTVKASHLRASQSELVGPKVAGMMKAMNAGKIPDSPIFVTRDGYIVDGHHRWAAKVGVDLQDGVLGDVEMPVNMIDLDIGAALDFANAFALAMGLIPKGTGAAAEGVKKSRLDRLAKALGASGQPKPTVGDPLAVALRAAARPRGR